jgi:plasmid maintenance system antidote protein VapI
VPPSWRAITGDTALRLAHFFGASAEFWLNLPALRAEDYFRERASRGDAGRAKMILKRAGRGKAAVAGDER